MTAHPTLRIRRSLWWHPQLRRHRGRPVAIVRDYDLPAPHNAVWDHALRCLVRRLDTGEEFVVRRSDVEGAGPAGGAVG